MRGGARRLRKTSPGLVAGYLPLLLVGALFIALVVFLPGEAPDRTVTEGAGSNVAAGGAGAEGQADSIGKTATGWGNDVARCKNRNRQVPASGYSPPCFTFSGDNGGATAPGVTGDTIRISHRHVGDGHLPATFAQLAGVPLGEDAEDIWETTQVLVDYFNENFELYGRKLEVERFEGHGSLTTELFGGGQENANVDARRAVDLEAFAEVNSYTQPYAEALADQGVISIGAPFMSREWFQERAPYAWSIFPDCTRVAELAAELVAKKLLDEPAVFAGGDLANRPRTVGIVHPNTTEYTSCARAAEQILTDAGQEVDVQSYNLDMGQTDSNATAVLAKLRDKEITTIACGCDPMMVRTIAAKAEQQGYQPEWYMLSTGFVDWDLVGQIIARGAGDQWSRAFGVTPSTSPEPFGASEAYRAFKSVRPDEEPSQFIDLNYSALYRLAIGIQMAGPNLTPETFQQGLFNYPGGTGAMGAWKFSPDSYTGHDDARMVYWDPDEPSPFNGQPGTYVTVGDRFTDPSVAPSQDRLEQVMGVQP